MPKISDDDIAFFHAVTKDVKPLKITKTTQQPKQANLPIKRLKQANIIESREYFQFSDHLREMVTADTKLFFAIPGLQPKTIKQLRKGEILLTRTLDLHGTTINEARPALSKFLQNCLENGDRCVLVIHGKGKMHATTPLLKNHVNNWLQQYPHLLAFCSAIPRDGGTGAVYVLLRTKSRAAHQN